METRTTENKNQRLILSGRALFEKLGAEETFSMPINGFYKKSISGATKVGNRSFKATQYRFIPANDEDAMVTIAENSAGGKMLAKQIEQFKQQFPDAGELGHYQSIVEFTHVTKIKDKETGQDKDVEFLGVRINPKSIGKRMFTPNGMNMFNTPEGMSEDNQFSFKSKEAVENQLNQKQ